MRISDWSSDVCSSDLNSPVCCWATARCGWAFPSSCWWPPSACSAPTARASCCVGAGRRRKPPTTTRAWHRCCRRRSEEHTSELQSLMRISYAVFCLQKKKTHKLLYCTAHQSHSKDEAIYQ